MTREPFDAVAHVRGYRPTNSSDSAYAVVVTTPDGVELDHRSGYIAGRTWTGIAEYKAAILGLETAYELGVASLLVRTSSNLLHTQMTDERPVRGTDFVILAQRVDALARAFDRVEWEFIATDANRADSLARGAYAVGPPKQTRGLHSTSNGTGRA